MSKKAGGLPGPWDRFHGPNLGYIIEAYDAYVEDPESVDAELQDLFQQWGAPTMQQASDTPATAGSVSTSDLQKTIAASKLAEAIRTYGHLAADVYPLQNETKDTERIDYQAYDLTEDDLRNLPAAVVGDVHANHFQNGLDAIQHLTKMYTKSLAFEFAHVHDSKERAWLREMVESEAYKPEMTNERKQQLVKRLIEVEGFEHFVHRTFVGQKRFSVEGVDTLIPLLDEMIADTVKAGAKTINIGMAHRGRLNVLAHVLEKPYELVFSEFQHAPNKELVPSEGSIGINYGWTGDVKYHLGLNRQIKEENTVRARVTLANNPSHLEFVDPVVEGFTRAAQEKRTKAGFPEQNEDSALAVLIHGDAAFPGQGIVAETLNMSQLRGYQTGGTIHIIANNMIGFTTESADSRSTKYASDLAKGYEIPIVHVNADDPEAVVDAAHFASLYRQTFKKDFLIDLIGYRRYGHNEMDEPFVTNPLMYKLIHGRETIKSLYAKDLQEAQVISQDDLQKWEDDHLSKLKAAYDKVPPQEDDADTEMRPPETVEKGFPTLQTAISLDALGQINKELIEWPEGFQVFKKLDKILKRRKAAFENDQIDWAHAESLAFGSILQDGTPIRLSGQDSERGTFAHRHVILHDTETGEVFSPFHQLSGAKASFAVHNSPLSEGSILGFEYGYNVFSPETLVLWEAQYGDFANAAQVIFDQFISAGRAKWGQKSGLVVLLPHGYEGQGPEHSSARLERFLTLAAENNWTVAYLSSSAQYFHLLRRQAASLGKEEIRPLIIMAPKSLLRHPVVASSKESFTDDVFRPIVQQPNTGEKVTKVERLVLATGKMAIDLNDALKDKEADDTLSVVRVEELYPFPKEPLQELIKRYRNLKEIVWVQEEPKNMGAWTYIQPYLEVLASSNCEVKYVGRRRRSSTAEGDPIVHKKEQARIISEALQQ
ncbi:2-oxoglutarate dehydrogenase E1 component [Bacillus fonticola]|uniref:2-oxoglutarate dehydrogenase E1 component n=1 Tax=Bacillus fonticola TaxID=2728853 RepID=UPI001474EB5C|nr:2-oxoglutarate dehydrogenase E1 component [Bacillus fonticola]